MSFLRKKTIISKAKERSKLLVLLVGPTAVGKTKVAIKLAKDFDTEIVSVDSRQFYSEIPIGTASPDLDEMSGVKHHFVGSHSLQDPLSAGSFEREAILVLGEIFQERDVAIAVGGSGLYLDALVFGMDSFGDPDPRIREELQALFEESGIGALQEKLKVLDPEYYALVDRQNHRRLIRALEVCISSGKPYSTFRKRTKTRDFEILWIGLNMERAKLYDRINQRVDQMIEQGLQKEAYKVLKYRELTSLNTVGYQEFFQHFDGQIDQQEAIQLIKRNSRRYAKRQLTWFRSRDYINWFSSEDYEGIVSQVRSVLLNMSSSK